MTLPKILTLVGIAMLTAAYADMPYGYYTLLRIVITGLGLFQLYSLFQLDGRAQSTVVSLLLVGLALTVALYNPFIPVYLARSEWQILNGLTIALFAYTFHFNKRAKPPSQR